MASTSLPKLVVNQKALSPLLRTTTITTSQLTSTSTHFFPTSTQFVKTTKISIPLTPTHLISYLSTLLTIPLSFTPRQNGLYFKSTSFNGNIVMRKWGKLFNKKTIITTIITKTMRTHSTTIIKNHSNTTKKLTKSPPPTTCLTQQQITRRYSTIQRDTHQSSGISSNCNTPLAQSSQLTKNNNKNTKKVSRINPKLSTSLHSTQITRNQNLKQQQFQNGPNNQNNQNQQNNQNNQNNQNQKKKTIFETINAIITSNISHHTIKSPFSRAERPIDYLVDHYNAHKRHYDENLRLDYNIRLERLYLFKTIRSLVPLSTHKIEPHTARVTKTNVTSSTVMHRHLLAMDWRNFDKERRSQTRYRWRKNSHLQKIFFEAPFYAPLSKFLAKSPLSQRPYGEQSPLWLFGKDGKTSGEVLLEVMGGVGTQSKQSITTIASLLSSLVFKGLPALTIALLMYYIFSYNDLVRMESIKMHWTRLMLWIGYQRNLSHLRSLQNTPQEIITKTLYFTPQPDHKGILQYKPEDIVGADLKDVALWGRIGLMKNYELIAQLDTMITSLEHLLNGSQYNIKTVYLSRHEQLTLLKEQLSKFQINGKGSSSSNRGNEKGMKQIFDPLSLSSLHSTTPTTISEYISNIGNYLSQLSQYLVLSVALPLKNKASNTTLDNNNNNISSQTDTKNKQPIPLTIEEEVDRDYVLESFGLFNSATELTRFELNNLKAMLSFYRIILLQTQAHFGPTIDGIDSTIGEINKKSVPSYRPENDQNFKKGLFGGRFLNFSDQSGQSSLDLVPSPLNTHDITQIEYYRFQVLTQFAVIREMQGKLEELVGFLNQTRPYIEGYYTPESIATILDSIKSQTVSAVDHDTKLYRRMVAVGSVQKTSSDVMINNYNDNLNHHQNNQNNNNNQNQNDNNNNLQNNNSQNISIIADNNNKNTSITHTNAIRPNHQNGRYIGDDYDNIKSLPDGQLSKIPLFISLHAPPSILGYPTNWLQQLNHNPDLVLENNSFDDDFDDNDNNNNNNNDNNTSSSSQSSQTKHILPNTALGKEIINPFLFSRDFENKVRATMTSYSPYISSLYTSVYKPMFKRQDTKSIDVVKGGGDGNDVNMTKNEQGNVKAYFAPQFFQIKDKNDLVKLTHIDHEIGSSLSQNQYMTVTINDCDVTQIKDDVIITKLNNNNDNNNNPSSPSSTETTTTTTTLKIYPLKNSPLSPHSQQSYQPTPLIITLKDTSFESQKEIKEIINIYTQMQHQIYFSTLTPSVLIENHQNVRKKRQLLNRLVDAARDVV